MSGAHKWNVCGWSLMQCIWAINKHSVAYFVLCFIYFIHLLDSTQFSSFLLQPFRVQCSCVQLYEAILICRCRRLGFVCVLYYLKNWKMTNEFHEVLVAQILNFSSTTKKCKVSEWWNTFRSIELNGVLIRLSFVPIDHLLWLLTDWGIHRYTKRWLKCNDKYVVNERERVRERERWLVAVGYNRHV